MAKLTHEQYVERFNKKFGNEYEIVGKYVSSTVKIKLLHKKCNNPFYILPSKIRESTTGKLCAECVAEEKRLANLKKFTDKLDNKFNGEWTYVSGYTSYLDDVIIKHKCGLERKYTPTYILSDNCNPTCQCNKGNTIIRDENEHAKHIKGIITETKINGSRPLYTGVFEIEAQKVTN